MNNIVNMGLTPSQIVQELDRHIIGQTDAKRAVAVALRNRYRRKAVASELQQEIVPKNILMIGPTGVGKTEIARRLARLANAPFIKVEATKFTEVGYVGRDVESIIRDLMEIAVNMLKQKFRSNVKDQAMNQVTERILEVLVGKTASSASKDKFKKKLLTGELDNTEIEINVLDNPPPAAGAFDIPGMPGAAMGVLNIKDILGKALGAERTKLKIMTIAEAKEVLLAEESEKLIDEEKIIATAIKTVENDGIVFLDEVDKICSRSEGRGGEVSREGVQRDLLPLIEGTTVSTKYGPVQTDHILFIASGAFHLSKPSDMLPELQGRMPIRVELSPLSKEDLVRILKEPEASLIKQYIALMATEEVALSFEDEAIDRIAHFATIFNSEMENIGARRLHTMLEKLLEETSFNASELAAKKVTITADFVNKQLNALSKDTDLAKFVL